ncbi:alginate lyase family protein [Methylorubrum salsuginis]|uniref:Alginate lyase n=1 Tax=Methylorubrum salsuginis TaxID=414703 RepID=A0A1I4MPA6_9HYPH|nr:alginate lyase family protein [Methylorubrum salsuginis]SFM05131.1 Alginate lyase [Methylorubrum salsuginis]
MSDPNNFVLLRILGNDLPPRHESGQTVRNLRFALENEPPLAGCTKIWILNRIVCRRVEAELIDLLEQHGRRYDRIPFDADAYRRVGWSLEHTSTTGYPGEPAWDGIPEYERQRIDDKTYEFKNLYLMNNNGARNHALTLGRSLARWVLPFDGNCFFTASAWERLRADVLAQPHLPYFIVPMARVIDNAALLEPDRPFPATHEPQVLFRSDAREAFDERFRYGTRPKVELLMRLGVPGIWDSWEIDPLELKQPDPSPDAGRFAEAGWVARLFSGSPEQEGATAESMLARGLARRSAILSMIDGLDERLLREDWEAGLQPSALEELELGSRGEDGSEASEHRDDEAARPREVLDEVYGLTLAWMRTGVARKAERAAAILRTWFADERAPTDPRPDPAPAGTESARRFARAVYALRRGGALSEGDEATFREWLNHRTGQPAESDTAHPARAVTHAARIAHDLRHLTVAACLGDARGVIDLLKANDFRLYRLTGRDGGRR